jgi:hypothetical protein
MAFFGGIVILIVALVIYLSHIIWPWLWAVGGLAVLGGIIMMVTGSVDETDVEELREKAEESREEGNYRKADELYREANELEQALNRQRL